MAEKPRYTNEYIERLWQYAQKVVSLNNPVVNDKTNTKDDTELGDLLESDCLSPEQEYHKSENKKILQKYIERLSPQQQKVLNIRWGLLNGKIRTLEETAKIISYPPVTRERIRQVEKKAIQRIRKMLKEDNVTIKDFYL